MPPLPDLVIIGAAKAGSTSLARWLDDHPEVCVARSKELNFFSYDDVWGRGLDWYAGQFADTGRFADSGQFDDSGARVRCDASPSYLPAPKAPERMQHHLPQARLVALLREPVDRTYAHYWWLRNWGAESRPFAEVVRAELDGELTPLGCIDSSRYVDHLERYAERFPPEQLLVLGFDDLSREPDTVFRSVCRFAGISEIVTESVGTAYNSSLQVRSGRLWRMSRRRAGRNWRDLPRGLDKLLVRRPERPPMEAEARQRLQEYFAPYNERLRAFWGRTEFPWERPG